MPLDTLNAERELTRLREVVSLIDVDCSRCDDEIPASQAYPWNGKLVCVLCLERLEREAAEEVEVEGRMKLARETAA